MESISRDIGNSTPTLAVQPDGKVLAGSRFVKNDDTFAKLIVRFNSDGSRDTSCNAPAGSGIVAPFGTLPRVLALARQSDGKVVIGGDFKINGESYPAGKMPALQGNSSE